MSLTIPTDTDATALGIYNVKGPGFLAAGNGTTDDTVAIQEAINAAYTAGGGIVYLPASKYLINGGTFTHPSQPGKTDGVYPGTTAIPKNHLGVTYVLTGTSGPNTGGGTMLPNGPLLLFDNVILLGDGPEQTILLVGSQIYGGLLVSPSGNVQNGAVVATANWWANYASDNTDFPDGFFAHDVYIRNLSIDCQGSQGINVGKPSHVLNSAGTPIPNSAVLPSGDGLGTPIGQLSDSALAFHDAQNCGVDNVWIYDGNVNGILVDGTQNKDARTNGPLPQAFQQYRTTTSPAIAAFITNATPTPTNVPIVNGVITNCQVDMNYPKWLAGSNPSPGGSAGQLPIRAIGAAGIVVANNRVGQRNQPSAFPTPPIGTFNPPEVGPNTNDAIDCPGAWHILIQGNNLTNCGDGIGSDGNGDMVIANNVMYNFGGVGIVSASASGKCSSQTVIIGNTLFLGSGFGKPLQQGIQVTDNIPPVGTPMGEEATATPGSVVISSNLIYGSAYSTMIELQILGASVVGNVFDYGGITPTGQPVYGTGGTTAWPTPNGSGIKIEGNDLIIEGNIFRNANTAGSPNLTAIGILFPSLTFPPSLGGDAVRVLIKGNIFDKTIGLPIQDNTTSGLLGVRILDNIGVNPFETLNPALVPFPGTSGATFANPYAYDCFVTVSCGATSTATAVALNGVTTGATILSGNQKSFLVKAGGTIAVTWNVVFPAPTWTWVGL